jgi:hypothetical protein
VDHSIAKRLSARLANAFVLDLVKVGGHGRDIAAPLIRAAVLHAGVAWMMRDPALQRQYATFAADVPDELRRPTAVSAIAQSISVPFETVRRQFAAMLEEGACRRSGRGLIVPAAVTSSPMFERGLNLQFQALTRLHADLRSLGLVETAPPPPGAWPEPPVRLAGRFVIEFVLRFREQLARQVPDPVSSVMLMEIVAINTEGLSAREHGGISLGGFVPDHHRTPAATSALAQRLGIANETARRHGLGLEAAGFCKRVDGGLIVPSSVLESVPVQEFVESSHRNLQRLFSQLAAFGVHQVFDVAA